MVSVIVIGQHGVETTHVSEMVGFGGPFSFHMVSHHSLILPQLHYIVPGSQEVQSYNCQAS